MARGQQQVMDDDDQLEYCMQYVGEGHADGW
jgi:hypothetical protein